MIAYIVNVCNITSSLEQVAQYLLLPDGVGETGVVDLTHVPVSVTGTAPVDPLSPFLPLCEPLHCLQVPRGDGTTQVLHGLQEYCMLVDGLGFCCDSVLIVGSKLKGGRLGFFHWRQHG